MFSLAARQPLVADKSSSLQALIQLIHNPAKGTTVTMGGLVTPTRLRALRTTPADANVDAIKIVVRVLALSCASHYLNFILAELPPASASRTIYPWAKQSSIPGARQSPWAVYFPIVCSQIRIQKPNMAPPNGPLQPARDIT